MKKITLFFILILLVSHLSAQTQEPVFDYTGLTLTGIWGGPSYGYTTFADEDAFVRGGFGGLEFNKNLFIGYGAFYLNDKIELPIFESQKLDFSYNGLMLGYSLNAHKPVHPKFSVLIGSGKVDVKDEDLDRLFIIQPSAGVEFNLFKWWHIDLIGGYRIAKGISLEGLDDSDVSAPFGEIKLRFGISWGWK